MVNITLGLQVLLYYQLVGTQQNNMKISTQQDGQVIKLIISIILRMIFPEFVIAQQQYLSITTQ